MNKITIDKCEKFQNFLYSMSDKKLIRIVKEFLDSEDVFYENTDESVGKYHQFFPLKHFDLRKLIKDNYKVVKVKQQSYKTPTEYLRITDENYVGQTFLIEIGSLFGSEYLISWCCAHKHCWYNGDYFYDKFYEKYHNMREKKLKRILK